MTYEENCLALDKTLASLLGWDVIIDPDTGYMWHSADTHYTDELIRWTQDDAEAFSLMVEYGLCVGVDQDDKSVVVYDGERKPLEIDFCEMSDGQATKLAIVQFVIQKLKGN